MTRRILPNGVTTERVYDAAGFLSSVVSKRNGTAFDSHVYTRDAVGNVLQENANGVNSTYVYDDLYRISSATVRGVNYAWTYDSVGNRLSQTAGGVTTTYTYNAANRLTAVNGAPVTHDANGNLVGYGNDTYAWDVRDRLLSLTRGGPQPLSAQFSYDYRNRRTAMTIDGWGPYSVYDGDDVVTELRGDPVHTLEGPNLDEPLVRHGPFFPAQFYTPDQLGSTTSLTDAAGNLGQQYQYGPFGEAAQSPTPGNPIQFAGRERDQSDPRSLDFKQTGLYFNRNRYYAPEWGRFISEDPIGFDGGINQYVYCDNDPINWVDPFGLKRWWQFEIPLPMWAADGARDLLLLGDIYGVARSAEFFRKREFFTQRPLHPSLDDAAMMGIGAMKPCGAGGTYKLLDSQSGKVNAHGQIEEFAAAAVGV